MSVEYVADEGTDRVRHMEPEKKYFQSFQALDRQPRKVEAHLGTGLHVIWPLKFAICSSTVLPGGGKVKKWSMINTGCPKIFYTAFFF